MYMHFSVFGSCHIGSSLKSLELHDLVAFSFVLVAGHFILLVPEMTVVGQCMIPLISGSPVALE